MKTTYSEDFHVDPSDVIRGASDAGLIELVIIGRDRDKDLYVSSSFGTPQTFALIDEAKPHINSLAEEAA